jgi:hypothetical protein
MLQYSETAEGQRALLTIGELLDSQQRAGVAALGPPTGPLNDLFATPLGTTGLLRAAVVAGLLPVDPPDAHAGGGAGGAGPSGAAALSVPNPLACEASGLRSRPARRGVRRRLGAR